MVVGDSDAGKTYTYLTIARWHQKLRSDAVFYGLVTPGNEWDRLLMSEFDELENIDDRPVASMPEMKQEYQEIKSAARPHDWLCVDVESDAWDYAQNEFTQHEHKQSLGEVWISHPSEEGHPIGGAHGRDWAPIKTRYNEWAQRDLMTFPGHLMLLYWAGGVRGADKNAEIAELWSPIGRMHRGEKNEYTRMHTIVYLDKNSKQQHQWRTVRDRGRDRKKGRLGQLKTIPDPSNNRDKVLNVPEPAGDFFTDYLIKIAGWKH